MHSSKTCFKCGKEKNLTEFYRHAMMADGHLNKCIECAKIDVAKHRSENIDKVRAYDRIRAKRPERMKSAAAISSAWKKADKRRQSAHSAVARAVMSGKLIRQPCERCGRKDAYAHHENYNNKLDVMWLCQPHHKDRHKELVLSGIEP